MPTLPDSKGLAIKSLLEVNAAQVQAVLSEIDAVAEGVTASFTGFKELLDKSVPKPNSSGADLDLGAIEEKEYRVLSAQAIIQLQSFDRSMQRLSHLRDSLLLIADNYDSDVTGSDLSNRAKAFCSMAHEVELHELAFQGSSREDLFRVSENPSLNTVEEDEEDELF